MPPDDPGYVVPKTEDGKFVLKHKELGDRAVTLEEMHQMAQKAHGAEKAMEARATAEKETAQLRQELAEIKDAVGQLRQAHLMADQGDSDAYQMVMEFMGLDQATQERKLSAYKQVWEDEEQPAAGGTPSPAELTLDSMPKEMQELVRIYGHKRAVEIMQAMDKKLRQEEKEEIYQEVFSDLEKDSRLGKILSTGGPRAEKLKGLAKKLIAGRVLATGDHGPEARAGIVKELSELSLEFGTGSPETPIPGLGLGPGLSHLESQADKPVERVPVDSPDYDNRAITRLAQIAAGSS